MLDLCKILLYKIVTVCTFMLIAMGVASTPNSGDEEINYRLPNDAKPIMYEIKLNPHLVPNDFTFDGETSIHVHILNSTNILTLHTKKLQIIEIATLLKSAIGSDFYVPIAHEHNNLIQTLSLDFGQNLSSGYYILYLKFRGVLNDIPYGFYRSSYIGDRADDIWFAGTNFMAIHARSAFPCWDEPAFKATFKIAIKHHPNYTALSNMPVSKESEIDESDGKIWTHFEESPVMSTYLVGFLISDLQNISNSDRSINVWSRANAISSASFVHEVAQKAAIELERYTNNAVRVPKIDHVVLPGFLNSAMESWGLITYREGTILYDKIINPINILLELVDSVIHQSSHQWLGNIVTPSWWTHMWMNGGLAEYLKYYTIDHIYKDWPITELLMTRTLNLILLIDSFESVQPLNLEPKTIKEVEKKSSSQVNRKVFLLIRMLSHCLTDDIFRAGLIKYLDKYKYGIAKPENLWDVLQNALDESALPQISKFRIRKVMDTWIEQKGYPLVTVFRDQLTGQTKITQEYFQPFKNINVHNNNTISMNAANNKWWIPINFATSNNPDFTTTLPMHWLSPKTEELIIENIDPEDWIIVNIQQTGFYRVNYDEVNWLKIADYLDSENYTKIHVLNRAQILDDAIYLVFMDKLDPKIFMELTKYLRRETDYIAWYPIFTILEVAMKHFVYNEGGNLLELYVTNLMNNIIETIGIQDRPNDNYFTKILRFKILQKACAIDHPVCLQEVHTQLITYLANPAVFTNKFSFQRKQWIICNGIKLANETIWNALMDMYNNNFEPASYCFGLSKNEKIKEKLLNMTISETLPIKHDRTNIFISVMDGEFPNIDIVINFIINHWDKLATILENDIYFFLKFTATVISKKQIQKMKIFLENIGIKIPEIIKIREHYIELIEPIVNKIRMWLEHRNANLLTNTTFK